MMKKMKMKKSIALVVLSIKNGKSLKYYTFLKKH